MIWVDNRFWPFTGKSLAFFSTVMVSPWTGQVWSRTDRGKGEWFPMRLPARGEKPWPHEETIPGSLFTNYDDWRWQIVDELPRPLLLREVSLIEALTSAILRDYNSPTLPPPSDTAMNQPLMQEIAALRAKEAAGTLTDDELRAVLRKMREGRVTAAATSAKARAPKATVDPDAALAALLG